MSVSFDLFDKVVVRNPLFCPEDITFENFKKNNTAKIAVYLASKTLYNESSKNNSEALNKSLYKYYLRSKYRPTPFGIFGSVSIGKFDNETNVSFINDEKSICHLKFDSGFLLEVSKKARSNTFGLYYLNPTVYLFHGVYRYINGFQDSSICEFYTNELIENFLNISKSGISFDSAINYFISNGIDETLANNFLLDLVERNILFPTQFKFMDHDSINFLIKKNGIINIGNIPSKLYLGELNKLIEYEDLISSQRNINMINQNIFHVDFYRNAEINDIGDSVKRKILKVIPFFFNSDLFQTGNSKLISFIDEFTKKYDKQEVPLLNALDPVVGIGYPVKSFKTATNFLVKDITIETNADDTFILSDFENYLLNKIINIHGVERNEISLEDEKFVNVNLDANTIPATCSVICELLKDERVLIKSIGGSTANSLLSRFSMFPEIKEFSREIAFYEKQQQTESKILVDICFLPTGKENNIVNRDLFYDYFIYFYPWEGMDFNKAISLDEISLRIHSGKIILFCSKLNNEIIPILPSAHNYFKDKTFYIYEFFCDIQGYKFSSNFNSCVNNLLSRLNHMPRIIYKQCVLSKEKWIIDIKNFENLPITKEQLSIRGYPDKFFIVEGDNELLVDFNEEIEINIFNKTINKKHQIIIEEFIEHYDGIKLRHSLIRNELIISIKKHEE
jgi:hypothetical protein